MNAHEVDASIQCWCGDVVPETAFSQPEWADCGGTGVFPCCCGGDLCVCHNHGEIQCLGCPSCDEYLDDVDDY